MLDIIIQIILFLLLSSYNLKSLTEESGHEIDQREIGVWKYIRTGINAYLKKQVKNYSKIDNSVK